MNKSIDIVLVMLMTSSIVVLILEAIGNKASNEAQLEKPHIRLFANAVLIALSIILLVDLNSQRLLSKEPLNFFGSIATLFLLINTFIAIRIGIKTKAHIPSGESFFLLLASLSTAVANIWSNFLIIKLVASTGWLLIMAALAVKTTQGGKKAEIALKLTFSALLVFVLSLFAFYFLANASLKSELSTMLLPSPQINALGLFGIMLFVLAGMSLAGILPFGFAHLDCADGSNLSTGFLILSNSMIQGASHLLLAKNILVQSGNEFSLYIESIAFVLAMGLLIACLRALDQSKIKRTASYVAISIGPLFCLSLLFGASVLLPQLIFIIALFSFATIALFALFGSLAYMDPIFNPWQTWEDISGFGRQNMMPSLYFLIALASVAGLPGTLGYFVKLSLIAPMRENYLFNCAIFASIAMGAASTMRIFVFLFSKQSLRFDQPQTIGSPPFSLMAASLILIILGFFPFVR